MTRLGQRLSSSNSKFWNSKGKAASCHGAAYFSAEDGDMTKPKAKVVVSKKAVKKIGNKPVHLKLEESHEEAPALEVVIHDPTI